MSKKGTVATWMASLAALFMVAPNVSAEEISYSVLLDRIESLEAQLLQQDAQFAAYSMGGGAQKSDQKGDACGSCQKGKSNCVCGTPAWYAAYEVTVLRPYISDANFGPGFSDKYGAGHRFIIGYDGGQGMGARLRYWTYNHGHDAIPPAGPGTIHLNMDAVDLEATLHSQMDCWDLTLAGGARYGRLAFSPGGLSTYFEGAGPTVAIEAKRGFGVRNLHLIGNARSSMLIGRIADPGGNLIFGGPVATPVDDEIMVVLESQLGVGWERELRRSDLSLRLLWETQFWMNDTFADDFNGVGSNLAFMGVTASAELRF